MTYGPTLIEDSFPACDGLRLFERRWQPTGEPRAEVLLVHGFVEHGGRHAPTAEALARRRYGVSVMDLRGHGKSDGARCFVRSFDEYVSDLEWHFDRVVRRAEGKPVFVLGHSLGGLIAVLWCIRRQPMPRGLILSGPALQVRQQLFPWLRHLAGLGSMLFPRLRLVRMGGRNISRDPAIIAQFRDDPLVFHGRFPVRTGAEILRAGGLARADFEQLRVPLLILHGTADRVAAVEASQALFERAEATDKTLRLYPELYHEVLNEPEKEQVLADLIQWIDRRIP
jgi:alpha-beta hydrolase superfamily lysophospholipase